MKRAGFLIIFLLVFAVVLAACDDSIDLHASNVENKGFPTISNENISHSVINSMGNSGSKSQQLSKATTKKLISFINKSEFKLSTFKHDYDSDYIGTDFSPCFSIDFIYNDNSVITITHIGGYYKVSLRKGNKCHYILKSASIKDYIENELNIEIYR